MGWSASQSRHLELCQWGEYRHVVQSDWCFLVQLFKYDFNLGTNPDMTMEQRFLRENTNDFGEFLVPHSANVIISEFKKFMYLVLTELVERDKNGGHDEAEYTKTSDGRLFFDSPFCAPPNIDKFWKQLILYNHTYEKFWNEMMHGRFVDRIDPREDYEKSYEKAVY